MRLHLAVSGVLLGLTAACGGSSGTSTGDGPAAPTVVATLAGTYNLQLMNGQKLPYAIQDGSTGLTIVSDQITMSDGGAWTEAAVVQVASDGGAQTQSLSDSGSWSRSGSSLVLTSTSTNSTAYSGTIGTSQLTLSDGAITYQFMK